MSHDPSEAVAILGPLVREHKTRTTYLAGIFVLGGLFSLFGLYAAGRGIYEFAKAPSGEKALLGALMAAPFLLVGAIALIWALLRLPLRVALHQGGVYYRSRKGEWAVPWPMVDGVYQKILRIYRAGVEVDVRDVYTIALQDGTMLEVDYHFEDVDAFGNALVGYLTDRLLPHCQQAFRAGQTLTFGVVGIDRNGVHADGKSLPWGEVESVSWKQGILSSDRAFLQIKRVGGLLAWAKVPVERVKNYAVLMAIVSEMARVV
jgi:hypothetical protein